MLSSTDTVKVWNCTGGTTYVSTIPFWATSDMVVSRITATGVRSTLTETTNYSIAATNDDYSSGATITTVATYSDGTLMAERVIPYTQETDYVNNEVFPAETLETGFDKLVAQAQQNYNKINLVVTLPPEDSGESAELPSIDNLKSKFLYVDADGNFEGAAGLASSPASTFGASLIDDDSAATALETLELDATAAEINTACDGITATAAEINTGCDGITATAAEVNEIADKSARVKNTAADYTVLDNDGFSFVRVTAGAADKTITLPTAAANTNRQITVLKEDSGAGGVIVDGEGAETISSSGQAVTTIDLDREDVGITLLCDGTTWHVTDTIGCELMYIGSSLECVFSKFFSGTSAAAATTEIAHGLDDVDKVITVDAFMWNSGTATYIHPCPYSSDYYSVHTDGTNVSLLTVTANCQSQKYRCEIKYYK